MIHTQPSSTATAGQAFVVEPVVYEEDRFGNLETSDTTTVITASLASGSGPLQGTITATVIGGVATFANLGDNTAETITVKFTGDALTSAPSDSIVISPAAASQLIIRTQPSTAATAGQALSTQPVIDEEDRFGNLETGDSSTVITASPSISSARLVGATATVSGGVATFTGLTDDTAGTIALDFSGGGLNAGPSNNISVSPAAASQLVIPTQPSATATAGQPFAAQPVIYEEDPYGNVETGDNSTIVTASLASGAGPLQGTTTATVKGGVATFTGLADDKAETITLQLTGGSLAAATTNTIAISPAAASELVIHTQPSATAIAGQPLANQPVIYEEDPYGNVETGDNSTVVTVSLASGAGPLQGTTTTTVTGGVATFTNLADNRAETIKFELTSGSLATATTNTIVVSPAAASQLVIHTQPSATAAAGQALSTPPVIYEEDRFGNLETGDNTTVITAASSRVRKARGGDRHRGGRRGRLHRPGRRHRRDPRARVLGRRPERRAVKYPSRHAGCRQPVGHRDSAIADVGRRSALCRSACDRCRGPIRQPGDQRQQHGGGGDSQQRHGPAPGHDAGDRIGRCGELHRPRR